MNKRRVKFIAIPIEIWEDKRLNHTERFLFAEIDSLDNDDGCFASNEYLAEFLGISVKTVSLSISKLKELGYVEQESFDGRKRVLKSNLVWALRQTLQKGKSCIEKNVKDIETKDNTDKERMNGNNNNVQDKMKNNIISNVKDIRNASKKQKDSHEDGGVCLNKNTKYKRLEDIIYGFTEDTILQHKLTAFVRHYNYTHHKLSNVAFELMLEKLKEISNNDVNEMKKIINVTIERGWKSFFPLTENNQNNKNTNGKSYFIESDKQSYEEYKKSRENVELATDEDGNLLKF